MSNDDSVGMAVNAAGVNVTFVVQAARTTSTGTTRKNHIDFSLAPCLITSEVLEPVHSPTAAADATGRRSYLPNKR